MTATQQDSVAVLPPLPEAQGSMTWTREAGVCINPEPGYTAEQMRAYALQSQQGASADRGEAVMAGFIVDPLVAFLAKHGGDYPARLRDDLMFYFVNVSPALYTTPPSPAESAEAVEVWQDGKMRLERRSAAPSGVSDADVVRATNAFMECRKPLLTDSIRAALEAAKPQPGRVEGWQPIETAPDSSRVILFCDARGNRWSQTADCRVPVCGLPPILWTELPAAPTAGGAS
jgi:hypothetical protein